MRERLEESGELSSGDTLAVVRRGLRYVRPFKLQFGVKVLLLVLSLLPLMVMPWPIKILIDHVIKDTPLGDPSVGFPFFMRPFLDLMAGSSKGELLVGTLFLQAVLLALVGAFGTSGRERDTTSGYLSSGFDSATRTENAANAGFSLTGGLLGLIDFRWTLRLTQRINHYYRTQLFERIQSLPMTSFDDERIGDAILPDPPDARRGTPGHLADHLDHGPGLRLGLARRMGRPGLHPGRLFAHSPLHRRTAATRRQEPQGRGRHDLDRRGGHLEHTRGPEPRR